MAKWAEEGSGVEAREGNPDIVEDTGGDTKPETRFQPGPRNSEPDALNPRHETRHPKP